MNEFLLLAYLLLAFLNKAVYLGFIETYSNCINFNVFTPTFINYYNTCTSRFIFLLSDKHNQLHFIPRHPKTGGAKIQLIINQKIVFSLFLERRSQEKAISYQFFRSEKLLIAEGMHGRSQERQEQLIFKTYNFSNFSYRFACALAGFFRSAMYNIFYI